MEAILTDCVRNSLRHFMHRNAIFMCQRLCAEFPSEKNLHLLASCYLQNNQTYCAYQILKGTHMAQCRYLFALSCFKLDLLTEAEAALSPNDSTTEVPNGAAGHYLLGIIYRYTDRRQSAIHHFNQALSLDPLLWAAYEELCLLGAAEEATSVFKEGASLCIQKQYLHANEPSEDHDSRKLGMHDNKPGGVTVNFHGVTSGQPINGGPASSRQAKLSGIPPPVLRNAQLNGSNTRASGAGNSTRKIGKSAMPGLKRQNGDEGKSRKVSQKISSNSGQRRSMRLAGESVNANTLAVSRNCTKDSSKYIGGFKLNSAVSRSLAIRKGQSWASENAYEGTRHDLHDDSKLNLKSSTSSSYGDNQSLQQEVVSRTSGAAEILGLLSLLGEGFRLSCLCRCKDALEIYKKLPRKHYNTGWVLSQVGKAYFEMVEYLEADCAFTLARIASPYSLEGMDIYSTVLYHLKEDMKLSYLAKELVSTDRLAPQSWIAMGNCYSLQRDNETALKNFQRSVQLDSRFAYAHTLCGHEYAALEDFENGIKSYNCALRVDSRHYNAWYGLGMIFFRQEKFEFSEHHFRMAFKINPRSSVIMSYLGMVLHALKEYNEALLVVDRAILADKKNPLPLYQKAIILISMENLDGALAVLEELKEFVPRESSIYALMGGIYKRKNMHDKAMLHYGVALDLKPSATDVASIKAAIERLQTSDEKELDEHLVKLMKRLNEANETI